MMNNDGQTGDFDHHLSSVGIPLLTISGMGRIPRQFCISPLNVFKTKLRLSEFDLWIFCESWAWLIADAPAVAPARDKSIWHSGSMMPAPRRHDPSPVRSPIFSAGLLLSRLRKARKRQQDLRRGRNHRKRSWGFSSHVARFLRQSYGRFRNGTVP